MRRIIVGLAALTAAAILVVWVLRRSHERDGREQPGAGSAAASAAHLRGRTAEPATGFTGERLDLEDDPAGDQRLEGQVIDDQEQPVAGARVVLDALPPRETTTEADGGFFFDGLIARSYRLEARSGDLAAGPVSTRLAPGSEPIIMRLRPASRLEVQVVDGKDAPIAGALVELRNVGAVQQTTDPAGTAVLRGLDAGTHILKVAAAGYASSLEAVAVSGAPGAVAHRRVQLR
ncbi:MAG TPA: carboxypeptidase-like regulatory domain-containing protein, partial [Kofleriaceae bacterium]|nr:carboxypeptidase-like regulatory domain-containing protein [Kofleriaceae bacterium]